MKLITGGIDEAERFIPSPSWVCISIQSPASSRVVTLSSAFREVLRLRFHDYTSEDWRTFEGAITDEQADQVIEFATRHRRVSGMLVHCEAGVSRSVSLAMALAQCFWWRYPVSAELREALARADRCAPNPGVFVRVVEAFARARHSAG